MSTPEEQSATPSFSDRVNEVVNSMTQDDKGNWQLPEGVTDEAVIYGANAERRRRDTQSSYTKLSQENIRLTAETKLLADAWATDFSAKLDPKVQAELEDLKITDPDAWRSKLNELEQQRQASFNEQRTSIQQKAQGESELDYRTRLLADFSTANPELQLTDDVIKNDIPPRLTNQLEKGEISFGDFLEKTKEYLTKGRVVAPTTEKPNAEKNLGKVAGSDHPSDDAVSRQLSNQYNEEIF